MEVVLALHGVDVALARQGARADERGARAGLTRVAARAARDEELLAPGDLRCERVGRGHLAFLLRDRVWLGGLGVGELAADIGFHSETNFYTGYSADISDGGLFLATYDLLPVGTELTISFMLPEGYQVTTRGHVSWLREPREADTDIRPGMGISFDSLAKDDYEAILRFTGRRPPLFYDR